MMPNNNAFNAGICISRMISHGWLTIMSMVVLSLAVLSSAVGAASAELDVTTDQDTYQYGDRLTIVITVQDITEEFALVYIQDANGTTSSPIPVAISGHQTTLPSPFPFDRITYPDGMYRIDVIYGQLQAHTEFEILDTDVIALPIIIRQMASHWLAGDISTEQYADILMDLGDQDILRIPAQTETIGIPVWVKEPTAWWLQDMIDDTAYVMLLQYIIDEDIR